MKKFSDYLNEDDTDAIRQYIIILDDINVNMDDKLAIADELWSNLSSVEEDRVLSIVDQRHKDLQQTSYGDNNVT